MCNQCEALTINGVYCHEHGCPNKHLDSKGKPYPKECKWCGAEFIPEDKEDFCDISCADSYHG